MDLWWEGYCADGLYSQENIAGIFTQYSDMILYLLMFLVGISVGMNRSVFKKIRQYHIRIFLIPVGIIAGTLGGGAVCCLLLREKLGESLAVVSGLGVVQSLSGVLVTSMVNARLGTIAFLSNLLREILSFVSIPWIAKHLNYYSAIAPAAATSEDTTLPVILKYTSADMALLAVFNGGTMFFSCPRANKVCYDYSAVEFVIFLRSIYVSGIPSLKN